MYCVACNQQISQDARFCSHCGRPVPVQAWGYASRRLTRPLYGRMIGGVCAGIADHYGWDPALVRVLAVVLFVLGHVFIFIAYIAAWIIMPNAPLFYVTPPAPYAPPPPQYAANPSGSTPAQ